MAQALQNHGQRLNHQTIVSTGVREMRGLKLSMPKQERLVRGVHHRGLANKVFSNALSRCGRSWSQAYLSPCHTMLQKEALSIIKRQKWLWWKGLKDRVLEHGLGNQSSKICLNFLLTKMFKWYREFFKLVGSTLDNSLGISLET